MYKLTETGCLQRLSDRAYIPPDPDNRDYAEYLTWLAGGGVPQPIDLPHFTDEAAAYMDTVRATREVILNRLPGIWLAALAAGDATTPAGADRARADLLALPSCAGVAAARDLDSLKAAVLAEFRRIVTVAPATLRSAFATEGFLPPS